LSEKISIFWFRRDLRLDDNIGLYKALQNKAPVLGLFIFDTDILDDLSENDPRVSFIHGQIGKLNHKLKIKDSRLEVRHGKPLEVWKDILGDYKVESVYYNHDYEPYARKRDERVHNFLAERNISFRGFKDQVIFEKSEVLTNEGKPYEVFTPYSRAWKSKLDKDSFSSVASAQMQNFYRIEHKKIMPLSDLGYKEAEVDFPEGDLSEETLREYGELRDYPAEEATSRIGVHLRFGTYSIRKVASKAQEHSEAFLNELIWRDFYQMVLWHKPEVVEHNYKRKYDAVKWRNSEEEFKKWCDGKTGYPMVDAGMRQLNQTGYMHNRVRMITASFLTKHLLIDWRWGEAYFADKLLDYELSSNNGGWQWAAGTGVDAAPYFRIFNPGSQQKKYDPEKKYIRKWIPELDTDRYPPPIVEHKSARERALAAYNNALD